jgi:hypothetical protein
MASEAIGGSKAFFDPGDWFCEGLYAGLAEEAPLLDF